LGYKDTAFCIYRDIPSSATDASNGVEPVIGIRLKPETSVCAQSSSEPPKKKKRITDDEQDTSLTEDDKSVVSKTEECTAESLENIQSHCSKSNKKYEISLADEKYVFLVHYSYP
jgi:hypothetical protein